MAYNKQLESLLKSLIIEQTQKDSPLFSEINGEIDLLDTLSVLIDKLALDKRMEGFRKIGNTYREVAKNIEICARNIEDVLKWLFTIS